MSSCLQIKLTVKSLSTIKLAKLTSKVSLRIALWYLSMKIIFGLFIAPTTSFINPSIKNSFPSPKSGCDIIVFGKSGKYLEVLETTERYSVLSDGKYIKSVTSGGSGIAMQ